MMLLRNVWTQRIGLLSGFAAMLAATYWWNSKPLNRAPGEHSLAVPTRQSSVETFAIKDAPSANASPKGAVVTSTPTNIRKKMKTAKDWYALAETILPKAQAGDPEAQYVIFMTYRLCTLGLSDYFKKYDTLEKAREAAMEQGLALKKVEDRYQRCRGFYRDDAASLSDPWDWLQKATDAGYGPAQAQTARERLAQDQLKAFVSAGAVPTDTAVREPIGGDVNPRDLLDAAVQSLDPEVVAEIGNLQHRLNPEQSRDVVQINSTAWMYVACQRGFDCSVFGPGTLSNCGPNDGQCTPVPNSFLARVNYNWAPVQEKVNQINAALNSKRWDQLPALIAGG